MKPTIIDPKTTTRASAFSPKRLRMVPFHSETNGLIYNVFR